MIEQHEHYVLPLLISQSEKHQAGQLAPRHKARHHPMNLAQAFQLPRQLAQSHRHPMVPSTCCPGWSHLPAPGVARRGVEGFGMIVAPIP